MQASRFLLSGRCVSGLLPMVDVNPFSRLLTMFRDVFASGRSQYFGVSIGGRSRARSPKRINLCEILLPVVEKSEGGELEIRDCLFAVTVSRNKGVEDIGDTFAALASEAGAACAQLPAEFQSLIRRHCSAVTQQPASRWIALLWEFHGGGLFFPPPVNYSGTRALVTQPFLVSVEAIAQCGLHTDTPVFRLREGVTQPDPNADELQQSQLDLTLWGGVTPMPPLNNDDESKTTPANKDRTESDASNPYHPADGLPDWAGPPDPKLGWLRQSLEGEERHVAEWVLEPSKRTASGSRGRTLQKRLRDEKDDYFGRKEGRTWVRVFIRDSQEFAEANARRIAWKEQNDSKKSG